MMLDIIKNEKKSPLNFLLIRKCLADIKMKTQKSGIIM